MKAVCVYCGSSPGIKPVYAERAAALGARLAWEKLTLVYGGGNVGLMGILADAVLAAGGEVIGVIPQQLVDREAAHQGLTRLEIVAGMHERKARMFELSDACIALPGGFGTLDEMFEMLTWRQLGMGTMVCAFLDVEGFYTPLIAMLDRMVAEGFLPPEQRRGLWHGEQLDALFEWIDGCLPVQSQAQSETVEHVLPTSLRRSTARSAS